MHWLLLLALLGATTGSQNGSNLNRAAEASLRRQIGDVRSLNVQMAPGRGRGDFNSVAVSLDGFSLDNLLQVAERQNQRQNQRQDQRQDQRPPRGTDDSGDAFGWPDSNRLNQDELGDILGRIGQGKWKLGDQDFGGVLGDILGSKGAGRIGRIRLHASNFSFQGTRYDLLDADLGEVRFDWAKALRGDFDIQSIAPGTLGLKVRGDQIARLISPKLPSLRDVRVRFSGGRAFVGAKSNWYGLSVPFEVGARLRVRQNEVVAEDFAASVARLRLPSFVTQELTKGVNPLYDFDPKDKWPLSVDLTTAGTEADAMTLRGGVRWIGLRK